MPTASTSSEADVFTPRTRLGHDAGCHGQRRRDRDADPVRRRHRAGGRNGRRRHIYILRNRDRDGRRRDRGDEIRRRRTHDPHSLSVLREGDRESRRRRVVRVRNVSLDRQLLTKHPGLQVKGDRGVCVV